MLSINNLLLIRIFSIETTEQVDNKYECKFEKKNVEKGGRGWLIEDNCGVDSSYNQALSDTQLVNKSGFEFE